VLLTLLLVAGSERFQERVERDARHPPTVSAVVLVAMGARGSCSDCCDPRYPAVR